MEFYIVREIKSGEFSKGTKSAYSWYEGGTTMFRKAKQTPPKLYTLGSAKTVRTTKKQFGLEIEIVPVTLTIGEPLP